ncbi:MAG TPA: hypothetical protein VHL34_21300 [Rhizomicrobium sp.]|jgi:hypothetical protein|nr:hypothetical protein [Rhizomicrobium sp.]
MARGRAVAFCALALIATLVIAGLASDSVLHYLVQSAPVWLVVVLGWRGAQLTPWTAMPVFAVWLVLFLIVRLFLFILPPPFDKMFNPLETAMSIAGMLACIAGLVMAFRTRSNVPPLGGALVFVAVAVVQITTMCFGYSTIFVSDKAIFTRLFG